MSAIIGFRQGPVALLIYQSKIQGALFSKKQGIRVSGRGTPQGGNPKKKSLAAQVTEKSVSVFVDKIGTEEKCWSENEHQPDLRDINTGIISPVKEDTRLDFAYLTKLAKCGII